MAATVASSVFGIAFSRDSGGGRVNAVVAGWAGEVAPRRIAADSLMIF
jgi:hypothetical protein